MRQTSPAASSNGRLALNDPTTPARRVEERPHVVGEAVILCAHDACDDLLARLRAITKREDGCRTFIELHGAGRGYQEMTAPRGVSLKVMSCCEPDCAPAGPRLVLHALAPVPPPHRERTRWNPQPGTRVPTAAVQAPGQSVRRSLDRRLGSADVRGDRWLTSCDDQEPCASGIP